MAHRKKINISDRSDLNAVALTRCASPDERPAILISHSVFLDIRPFSIAIAGHWYVK